MCGAEVVDNMTDIFGDHELGLKDAVLQKNIVPAAKALAASIRHTLWLKEYKRVNPRWTITTPKRNGGTSSKLRGRDDPPPIIDGPIYSSDYWRKWQGRSKSRVGRGGNERNVRPMRNKYSYEVSGSYSERGAVPCAPHSIELQLCAMN